MSLSLTSTDHGLNRALGLVNRDGKTSEMEFRALRKMADTHVAAATGIDVTDPRFTLGAPVVQFLYLADALVESLERLGAGAEAHNLAPAAHEALRAALEHQIAYIVAGYQFFVAQPVKKVV